MKKSWDYVMPMVGKLRIVQEDGFITGVYFTNQKDAGENTNMEECDLHREAERQLREYLAGTRKVFALSLKPAGTAFQMRVWDALQTIPCGETRAYGVIARQIGSPMASRAVGMANNRNPISIIVPCHRVIGADGKLVGYGGGLDIKEKLLEMEKQA